MNQRGERNHNARMGTSKALRICRLLASSQDTYQAIADKAGATYSQVAGIAKRQTWLHISESYKFKTRAVQERRMKC